MHPHKFYALLALIAAALLSSSASVSASALAPVTSLLVPTFYWAFLIVLIDSNETAQVIERAIKEWLLR
jgi:hypothetical protein